MEEQVTFARTFFLFAFSIFHKSPRSRRALRLNFLLSQAKRHQGHIKKFYPEEGSNQTSHPINQQVISQQPGRPERTVGHPLRPEESGPR